MKGVDCPVSVVDFYYEPIYEPPVRELIFPFGCATNYSDKGHNIILSLSVCNLAMYI